MKTILVVTQPFADYAKGDHITDPDAVKKALASNASHVVRTAHPGDAFYAADEPAPEDETAPKAKRKAAPKAEQPTEAPDAE